MSATLINSSIGGCFRAKMAGEALQLERMDLEFSFANDWFFFKIFDIDKLSYTVPTK
jgi:hypothetical protein